MSPCSKWCSVARQEYLRNCGLVILGVTQGLPGTSSYSNALHQNSYCTMDTTCTVYYIAARGFEFVVLVVCYFVLQTHLLLSGKHTSDKKIFLATCIGEKGSDKSHTHTHTPRNFLLVGVFKRRRRTWRDFRVCMCNEREKKRKYCNY